MSNYWPTETCEYTDAKGNTRTAIVPGGEGGSIDVLNQDNERVCEINVFVIDGGTHVIVDVIDVDNRYPVKRALVDPGSSRSNPRPEFSFLVSADMKTEAT
jgi:hypothetical protein